MSMTVKTIHILDKTVEISSEPNYDRLGQYTRDYPPLWAIITELIATGEIPRYRGTESSINWEADRTTIITQFATREGAEKWAEWVRNDNHGLISITVVEN
jgi:hypothetical protein